MAPRTKKAEPATLAWKGVSLPSEATAGAGTTDADFWVGLDADDEGFMGLQEIDDVRVVRDGPVVQLLPEASSSKAVAQAPAEAEEDDEEEEWQPIGSGDEQDAASDAAADEPELPAAAAAPAADKPPNKRERAKAKAKERLQKLKAERKAAAALASAEAPEDEEEEGKDAEVRADFSVLAESAGNDEFDGECSCSEQLRWPCERCGSGSTRDCSACIGRLLMQGLTDSTLPKWRSFGLHAPLRRALHSMGFKQPTSIQSSTLPLSLPGERDVVGIAQTGSGKTLAYGLPILQYVLATLADPTPAAAGASSDAEREDARPLAGLILCPTRELALQVSKHLNALVEAATPPGKKMRFAGIATLTGGMSEEKQRRLLHRGTGADIVVATPGRLWDMCESDDTLTARIKRTRFLVVDEADRMIETGHFAEMEQILALVRRAPSKGKNA
jgi:ATP-dependent RNA helicase DDX24/MAK5